jgi:hypothetical protein
MACNGDTTTLPKAFADLTGNVAGSQLPGGTPTGTGTVVMAISPALTGTPTAPTQALSDNSTALATTAWVKGQGYSTGGGGAVSSVFTRTGAVVAVSGDYAVAQVTGAAPLASPALTGVPTAPTASTGDNSTTLATTAFVKAQSYITSAGAPVQSVAGRTGAIVLAESDITNLTTDLAAKAPLASPTLTGTPAAPTAAANTNTTQIATTAFVIGQAYAPLASPALTGTPTAPTAASSDSSTTLATTAFVKSQGFVAAKIDLTAQVATITNANLLAAGSVQTGMYQLSGWIKKTTIATTSSTTGPLTITFTDGTDSTSLTPTLALLTSAGAIATTNANNVTTVTGVNTIVPFTFFAKTGVAITYTLTYASSGATAMQFELHMRLDFLG